MKIAVCLKQVPSTETRVKIASDGKHIDPAGVSYVLNPYDEFAVEAALQLKEAHEGEVVVLSVGGAASMSAIRNALAMGADRAVLLETEADTDSLGVARLLADELKDGGWDLILTGKQAVDDDCAQVGPMLAEFLDLPCATVVVKLDLQEKTLRVTREIEGGHEIVELPLPALLACQKGLNEPRYASLKGIMAAKKKPVEQKKVEAPEATVVVERLALPDPRTEGRVLGEGTDAIPELLRVLREEAKVLG